MAIDYSELLDTICSKTGFDYISDLKFISSMPEKAKLLAESLEDIDAGTYPSEQWSNLCYYMLNVRCSFPNGYEYKRFILDNLHKMALSV